MSLAKVLYRDLLLAARQFDRDASLRALISSSLLQRPVVPGSTTRVPHLEALNRCLLNFLGRKSFYVPLDGRKPLALVVQEKFRAREDAQGSGEGIDLALAALRLLTDTLAEARDYGLQGGRKAGKRTPKSTAEEADDAEVSRLQPLLQKTQLAECVALALPRDMEAKV